jgi:hypothetical protein
MPLEHNEVALFVAPDENERGELCTLPEGFSNIHEILTAQAKDISTFLQKRGELSSAYKNAAIISSSFMALILRIVVLSHLSCAVLVSFVIIVSQGGSTSIL